MRDDLGIRVDVKVLDPNCPVRDASSRLDAPTDHVVRSANVSDDGEVTEEFSLAFDGERPTEPAPLPTEVFRYGDRHVYRFSRSGDRPCLCHAIESFGRPVFDIHVADGAFYASFHVLESEDLGEILGALGERFSFTLQRMTHTDTGARSDLVIVDRSRLTDRQREVLETAHRLGYFERPRKANAGEVASHLDIHTSTFAEHLGAAQRKLLDAVLDD